MALRLIYLLALLCGFLGALLGCGVFALWLWWDFNRKLET
jgi:hypothetical protein